MKRLAVKAVSFVLLLALICCLSCTSVSATTFEDVPFESFSYWNNSSKAVPSKSMFVLENELVGANFGLDDGLNTPTDIFIDGKYIYLLDSDNSRLIIADKKTYDTVSVISDPVYKDEELHFRKAQGVFANEGKVYICDTENERLIICNIKGKVQRVITCPKSDIIPEDFVFAPSKLVCDSKGFFYLISSGCFYGAMRFDSDFKFLGFYGANVTSTSASDILSNIIDKIFSNNEKISGQAKKIPYQFVDLSVDSKDFVFTVTGAGDTGAIRRLNPGGTNVFKVLTEDKYITSDSLPFGVLGSIRRTFINEKSSLMSVTVDENGFIYVVDAKFGRVLVYDELGVMLCAFAGGLEDGDKKGTFKEPASIHIDGDLLYVVDSIKNSVSVFRLTEYGKKLIEASLLTNSGEYEKSKEVWNEVLAEDANCQAAYNGLSKALMTTGEYSKALSMAKKAKNSELYGDAFVKVRADFFDKHFYLVIGISVAIIAVIAVLLVIKRKKKIVIFKDKTPLLALGACIHPFNAYKNLKSNKKKHIIIASVFLFLFFFVTLLNDFFMGYMYGHIDPASYNAFFTLLGTTGVALLYIVANWGICSIQGGKGKMYEIYVAVAYSLIPVITYRLFLLIISNVMTSDEAFFLGVFNALAYIIAGFSLLVANMEIHEYDFFKVMKTTVLIILGMGLIIFLLFMIIILVQQLFTFFETIKNELLLR